MSTVPSAYTDNPEESTGLAFMRAYNTWVYQMEKRLRKTEVTHPQFVVLATLAYLSKSQDEISQATIARMAEADVMTVSQILIVLEKKGCLERHPHSRDARAKAVVLTPLGEETLQIALKIVEEVDALFFGSLKESETSFKTCLTHLRDYRFPAYIKS